MQQVFVHGPCPEVWNVHERAMELTKRFPSSAWINHLAWSVWRRLPRRIRTHPPDAFTAWAVDWRLVKWIEPSCIFHGPAGLCLSRIRTAKKLGAVTLAGAGSLHPRHWQGLFLRSVAD